MLLNVRSQILTPKSPMALASVQKLPRIHFRALTQVKTINVERKNNLPLENLDLGLALINGLLLLLIQKVRDLNKPRL